MLKENFLESAPRCNGVHLQGEELNPPGMHLNANQGVVTGLPRTDFFGSRASVTKEKTRRVGEHMSESLCTCTLVENTPLICVERVYIYIYIWGTFSTQSLPTNQIIFHVKLILKWFVGSR